MRWNHLLPIGGGLGVLVLLTASAYAQAVATDKPADPQLAQAQAEVSGRDGARSAEAWAEKDAVAADRSLAATVRYVEATLASNTATGLKAARSLGEKAVTRATAATEQAWATATDVVHRMLEKGSSIFGTGRETE